MKLEDLLEKGPIIGAPKGSQKDSRMGTDDPSKYMRGGEWEAYREPQGVGSSAEKVASGKKSGNTRTKNKKMSEAFGNSIEYYSDQGLAANPDRQYVENLMRKALEFPTRDPHLKGFYDPRGTFWVWDGRGDTVHHAEVEPAIVDAYGFPEFEEWLEVVSPSLAGEGVGEDQAREYFEMEGGMIPFIISPKDPQRGGIGQVYAAFPSAQQAPEVQRALGESLFREGTQAGIFPGGAGVSGDLVAKDRDTLTLADLEDTVAHNTGRPKMDGSKAPTKTAKKTVKKSLTNTPGDTSPINETIHRSRPRNYNADYELRDDADRETIGRATIRDGVIHLLAVRNDIAEDYNGHVLSRLLSTIIRDADMADANLAIQVKDPNDLQHKRFMERFGFRDVGDGLMKRNAGSVTPPSVPSARI